MAELENKEVRWGAGLIHLFVVYVVWGSTYLAIRLAVREGSGMGPFLLGATRTLAAGTILLGWNMLRRNRLRPTRGEAFVLATSGLLLWLGGNGLVNWAEQHADSGYAALLIGTTPLWLAVVESLLDRRAPTFRLTAALLVGFAGLGLLTYPEIRHGGEADLLSLIALLLAPMSWVTGSVLLARRPVKLSPTLSSGYQQLTGSAGFFLVAWLLGEPMMNPTAEAWGAWAYLVVAGSVIAFTSYIFALRLLPPSVVMTYAYVNPVIAVFLGWLILDEPITGWTVGGTVLILLGIAGVFHEKRSKRVGSASKGEAT
jgi:drug/metabolite transporter (DMT)-like permease